MIHHLTRDRAAKVSYWNAQWRKHSEAPLQNYKKAMKNVWYQELSDDDDRGIMLH